MDDLSGYVSDDELAMGPLRDLGWGVELVPWRNKRVNWGEYEAVVIRTTWDYQNDPELFIDTLCEIEATGTRLENSIELVRWNLSKEYLRDLEASGLPIVPTIWSSGYFTKEDLLNWMAALASDELIIKPTVSATAQDTYRVAEYDPKIAGRFVGRKFMVQPFLPQIVDEGEFSVFFFDGVYSHAILKAPKKNDFRVQEEHGGIISSIKPEERLLALAATIDDAITPRPLYSRVDMVRSGESFALMELELIEPALYFRTDPDSPARFAAAFNRRMNEL